MQGVFFASMTHRLAVSFVLQLYSVPVLAKMPSAMPLHVSKSVQTSPSKMARPPPFTPMVLMANLPDPAVEVGVEAAGVEAPVFGMVQVVAIKMVQVLAYKMG
jgi:hypothetical protein